ncbi:phosphoketolase family protein [Paenibacillus sp. ClWae2A]|uniref:phosphoketolase family protein n=1 Tax=Paenibacillus sp. ClWae2A TaxID=3057177 RepID=UPI0028F630B9|nr:phosphoketolase family protein [Paenibacillus sp. ClWae2A]MDT9722447.1 phosphoketolase family protein [Paenibacillus sp. ClWae2A]
MTCSEEEINNKLNSIDKYWRASNYLTLVQMYLQDNYLLQERLQEHHVKNIVPGHWGTSPGINFIYAHLNGFITRTKANMSLIIGPGHGACALLANLYLEGTLQRYYPELTFGIKGIENLSRSFGDINGFRTEISPHIPGTIYGGGELGYALAVAHGNVMDNPDLITVCIVGDGEAETGPTAAAWQSHKYLDPVTSGVVLPILHLNGHRMGGPSIMASMTDEELRSYFEGLGYTPYIVLGDHKSMFNAIENSYELILSIKESKKNNTIRWPMIILKTQKGWTGVSSIEGRAISHKNPISDTNSSVGIIEEWLLSYNPGELFNSNGFLKDEISEIIPKDDYKLGLCLERKNENEELFLPDKNIYSINHGNKQYKNIEIINDYLGEILSKNKKIRIMSPDELVSNGLGKILTYTKKAFNRNSPDEDTSPEGKVMEILSEHTCHGWLQGYLQSGGYGLLPTYEAFAPIFGSMMTQYAKFIHQSSQVTWRKETPSLNYLLTSLCWANTYSHQNPEFISTLTSKTFPFVRCYFPIDANSLLKCMEKVLKSYNKINVIVTSKREMYQWTNMDEANVAVEQGFYEWPCDNKADFVMVSAGDYPLRESKRSIEQINELIPHIYIKLVSIIDITILGDREIYTHSLSICEFNRLFPVDTPILFNFHGYPSTIKALVYERTKNQIFDVIGYADKGDASAPELYKLIQNGVSHFQISFKIIERLKQNGKISKKEYNFCKSEIENRLNHYCNSIV